jgi:hypothetical protein
MAETAGAGAVMDAQTIELVNKRVSVLSDYQTVVETALFFDSGKANLSDADKQTLSKLGKVLAGPKLHD